jgi:hypothetical protein
VAKHIQLPAVGRKIGDYNKGICYSNQSSLQTGTDAQYYNRRWNSGFGWADGCLGHDTLLVRQELMTNQYFIGIDTDK